MSTINITDNFGLALSVTPASSSALSKYLKSPSTILATLASPKDITALKISDDPFNSQSAGLTYKDPITLGSTGVELDIQPAMQATVDIATGKNLFDAASDPFGDSIPIPAGDSYVSMAIQATLDLTATDKAVSDLSFGINNQTKILFTDYRLYPSSTPIVDALKALFGEFTIPADLSDIDAMATGMIATVAGTGSLKLTAEADLPASVNPLATVSDTFGGILNLSGGGTIAVKGAYTLTGGYQVRVQRLDGRKFQLGVLKQRSTELDVSVTASLGATATAAGEDWIQLMMKAASPDPVPDKDALKQDGLTDDQIASINAALKAGVERSLQLAAKAEIDALQSESTAFSYEVDLDVVETDASGAAQQAIHLALDGDLTGLEGGPVVGVKPLKSVISTLKQQKTIFQLNILGIINVGSLRTLVTQGTVIVDQESGAVTITDKVTAQNIGFTTANFARDNAKLRQVLADSTLITAAYHTGGMLPGLQIATKEWFFDFHQKANLGNVQDSLNIVLALHAISPAKVAADIALLGSGAVGSLALNISATYDDGLFRSMFLDANSAARTSGDFQKIARTALAALIPPGDDISLARRVPLTDDRVWEELLDAFNQDSALTTFFENHPASPNAAADIRSDFFVILWWSDAMTKMAKQLAALQGYFASNPKWTQNDNQFKQLRKALNKAMGGVAASTTSQFREPLGLLSMDLASGQKAATTVQFSSPRLSLTFTR